MIDNLSPLWFHDGIKPLNAISLQIRQAKGLFFGLHRWDLKRSIARLQPLQDLKSIDLWESLPA